MTALTGKKVSFYGAFSALAPGHDLPGADRAGGGVVNPAELLEARNISKTYGGVRALKDVTFTAYRGKVNVLVGENGAGKSTLMKILSGSEQPTSGEILLDGEPVQLAGPRDAMARGIGIIHQELSLFPNLSDRGEHVRRPGAAPRRAGSSTTPPSAGATREVLPGSARTSTRTPSVGDLPIGQQQLVEIGRALLEDVRVLIMDEPTSALSNHEVDVLFEVMADLRRAGRHGHLHLAQARRVPPHRRLGHRVPRRQPGRRTSR